MIKKIIVSIIVIGLLLSTPSISMGEKESVDEKTSDVGMVEKTPMSTFYGNTLYVGGNGPDNYTKIQDAIDNASDGDTIYVYDDSSPYHESVVIGKSISLIGEDKDTTVIDGKIKINKADGATVSGFMIKRGGLFLWFSSNNTITGNSITDNTGGRVIGGIDLWSSDNNIIMDNTITDNTAEEHFYGIFIQGSSYNTISGNTIANNTAGDTALGINLDGLFNNTIVGNTIANNIGDSRGSNGIHLSFAINTTILDNIITDNAGDTWMLQNGHGIKMGSECYGNTISGNIIADNTGVGIDLGGVSPPHNNTISENTITDNLYGMWLGRNANGSIISANDISNNDIGILLEGSGHNTISANNISDNNHHGISLTVSTDPVSGEKYYPNDNNIYYNNFETNGGIVTGGNAKDVGSNTWDDGEAMGNYWDDYIGLKFPKLFDSDGDGIGDIPYDIPGGDNQDNYPLMGPWPDPYPYNNNQNIQSNPQTNPTPSQQYSSSPSSQNQVESSSPAESEITVVENVQYVPLDTGNDYRPRDCIYINGNDEFNEANGVEGGSGTESDPYIIEWWELPSIEISYTTAYFIIRHCYLYGDSAVDFRDVGNGTVQDCILEASGNGYDGFIIVYANNIIIEYCNITNYGYAVWISYTRDSIIHHCMINECVDAFRLDRSNNNIIHHCEIVNGDGFLLYYSNNNIIHNCTISDCCFDAFALGESNNNIIHHCEIVNCDGRGFDLYHSNNNIIHTCNLSGGESAYDGILGFDFYDCLGNTIYHNNIINFQLNAYTSKCGANQWDNGAEGNYWDDYIGVDYDGDGIGDCPDYHIYISLFNEDRYPLMGPYPDAYPYNNNQNIQSNPQSNQIQSSTVVISNPQANPVPESGQIQQSSTPK